MLLILPIAYCLYATYGPDTLRMGVLERNCAGHLLPRGKLHHLRYEVQTEVQSHSSFMEARPKIRILRRQIRILLGNQYN